MGAQYFENQAFVLETALNDMFLVAKRRIERDILLHELNTVCRESNY